MSSVKYVLGRCIITKEKVHNFARKAQRYTCAYYVLYHNLKSSTDTFVDEHGRTVIDLTGRTTLPSMESLVKEFKTHRCALDFSTEFITTEARKVEKIEYH